MEVGLATFFGEMTGGVYQWQTGIHRVRKEIASQALYHSEIENRICVAAL